ncbi:MAG: hypothetical protein WBO95_16500 [Candidatus Dechloromonas phosphoritropha]
MLNHEPSGLQHQYRHALLAQARTKHYSHWTTLNTHRDCSMDTAVRYLNRWRVEVLRRLHGQKFYRLPAEQLTQYFGCPEFTLSGQPHFHLACAVPESLAAKFERIAADRWLAIVPSGTHHIRRIGPTDQDQENILTYATKRLNPNAAVPFVDSRLYQ